MKMTRIVHKALALSVLAALVVAPSAMAASFDKKITKTGYHTFAQQSYTASDSSGKATTSHGWLASSKKYEQKAVFSSVKVDKKSKYKGFGDLVGSYYYNKRLSTGAITRAIAGSGSSQTARVDAGSSISNKTLKLNWSVLSYQTPVGLYTQTSICNDRPLLPDTCDRDTFVSVF